MISRVLKLIGAEPDEEHIIILLLSNGFFMGIFLATYQIGAESIFLDRFKGEYLELAFVVTGALGIVFTYLYSTLQYRIRFSRLALYNLIILALIIFGIWMSLTYFGNTDEFIFAAFILLGPIMALALLGFWGVFYRLFDLRQSKRIIGGIDTGQLGATILAFFMVPVLTRFSFFQDTKNLFLISFVGVIGSLLFLIWIINEQDIDKQARKTREEIKETSFQRIFKSRYVVLLAVFLMISVVVLKFVNFSFLKVVPVFFTSETAIANFLGPLNAVIMVLSFLIQTFVNDKIIGDYGLRVSLMVMPIILIIFTLLAILTFWVGGSDNSTASFGLFFLFISLSKLFTQSLRDALENPAFKLYFLPLNLNVRFDIQTKIEGVIGEFGNVVAGALILTFSLFQADYIHYSYVILVFAVAMIYVVSRLYHGYRIALQSKLSVPGADEALDRKDYSIPFILEQGLHSGRVEKMINSVELTQRLEPMLLDYGLQKTVESGNRDAIEYAIRKIVRLRLFSSAERLEEIGEDDPELKKLAEEAKLLLNSERDRNYSTASIQKLAESASAVDRITALRLIAESADSRYHHYLHDMLRDLHVSVRINAIITAAQIGAGEFWHPIIENLGHPSFMNTAMVALVHLGEPVLDDLENAFQKSGQSISTLIRILRVYGRIGGEKATDLLWNKFNYPEPAIIEQAYRSLSQSGYQATPMYRNKIKTAIEEEVSRLAWNIAAFSELSNDDRGNLVKSALVEENQQIYRNIFMHMAMIYEDLSVKLVRENIESGNTEEITYAIELLDIFVDEDLKLKLIPLFDDIPDHEKIRRLQLHYPRDTFDSREILIQIINRDYNKLNRWTKVAATYALGQSRNGEVTMDLIANLFNPDEIIKETSAWAIFQLDKGAYEKHTMRLGVEEKKMLDGIIARPSGMSSLMFQKILYFRKLRAFKDIPSVVIAEMVKLIHEEYIEEGTLLIKEGQYHSSPLFFIVHGMIRITDDLGFERILGSNQFFGASLLLDPNNNDYYAEVLRNTVIMKIERNDLYRFLSENYQVLEKLTELERSFGEHESVQA